MNVIPIFLLGSVLASGPLGGAPVYNERITQEEEKETSAEEKTPQVSLDWLLDHPELFTATKDVFLKQYPKETFAWQDKEKSRARFNPDRVDIKLRGQESGETIISFKEDRISGVIISVVNKGDDGFIKMAPYQAAIEKARATLKAVAKVAESPRKKNETISKAEGSVWSTKKALYILEHLWVPEEIRDERRWFAHAEFVRIRILPPQVLLGVQQNTLKTNVSRPTLAKRVKKEGTKVWLEGIPMVDQGSKGYCAVASFERVMRYYGSQVDMHDLADLANSNGMGTSPSGIKDAVHKMAVRSGLRTREPIFMESKHFDSLRSAYNREAKKVSLEPVGPPDQRGVLGLYLDMDPELCRSIRAKDAGFAKFGSEVARSINAGIPIMWALQLGMFWEEGLEDSFEASRGESAGRDKNSDETPEAPAEKEERPKRPPPGMAGGHMRIILGYDTKERLVYYSDSWGPGHEMKQMSLEEAWAVTMGLFILEP